ncbi:MAG: hypothetical protein K6T68_12120, partial [Alicyclobacillus shizuokensis]|nr:hypothetical protein [Alicyclobacillus shizuokensis]
MPDVQADMLLYAEGDEFQRPYTGLRGLPPLTTIDRSSRETCGWPRLVLIGASTGGPAALARLLPEFPPGFAAPIV